MFGNNRILKIDSIYCNKEITQNAILDWCKTSEIARCFLCDILPDLALPIYDLSDGKTIHLSMQEKSPTELEEIAWACLLNNALNNGVTKREQAELWFAARDLPLYSFISRDGITIAVTEPDFLGMIAIRENRTGIFVSNQYAAVQIE